MTPAPPCRRALAAGLVSVALGALGLAACDRGGRAGDTASFCADVDDNIDYLRFADFQNLDQVDTIIDLYTKIGKNAPLEIEADWDAIVLELRTVRDTDLTDADAVEEMYGRIYATEPSLPRGRRLVARPLRRRPRTGGDDRVARRLDDRVHADHRADLTRRSGGESPGQRISPRRTITLSHSP